MSKLKVVALVVLLYAFVFSTLPFIQLNLSFVHFNHVVSTFEKGKTLEIVQVKQLQPLINNGLENQKDLVRHMVWVHASQTNNYELGIDALKNREGPSKYNSDLCTPIEKLHQIDQWSGVVDSNGLAVRRSIDQRLAVLLYNSHHISDTFCVSEAGLYKITLSARSDSPPPIEIGVKVNGWLVPKFYFSDGNGNWDTQHTEVILDEGTYKIDLFFANDFIDVDNKIDRNARVDTVKFQYTD